MANLVQIDKITELQSLTMALIKKMEEIVGKSLIECPHLDLVDQGPLNNHLQDVCE